EPSIEDLVLEVHSGLRLKEHAYTSGLADLVDLLGSRRGRDLERARAFRFRFRRRAAQARPFMSLRGGRDGLDDLGGRLGQDQHVWSPLASSQQKVPRLAGEITDW